MCYSVTTSVISFCLGIGAAIFGYSTRQPILATLILFYSQMQLSEAMIWRGLDTNNIELNKTGTTYGQYLLPSHNIAIGLGILLSVLLWQKKHPSNTDFIPLMLGAVFYLIIILGPYRTESYSSVTYPADPSCVNKSCQNNNNRLRWPYPHSWYIFSYILSLILLILYIRPWQSQLFLASMFTVTLIVTAIWVPRSVGSVWCFSAAILAPVLVLGNYLIIRNNPNAVS